MAEASLPHSTELSDPLALLRQPGEYIMNAARALGQEVGHAVAHRTNRAFVVDDEPAGWPALSWCDGFVASDSLLPRLHGFA